MPSDHEDGVREGLATTRTEQWNDEDGLMEVLPTTRLEKRRAKS